MLRRNFLLNLFSGVMALLLGMGRKLPAKASEISWPLDSEPIQLFGVNWIVTRKKDLVPEGDVHYFAQPKFIGATYEMETVEYSIKREPCPGLDLGFLRGHQPATMKDAVVDVRSVVEAVGRELTPEDQAVLREAISPDIATYETDQEVLQRLSPPAVGWHDGEQVLMFRNEWSGMVNGRNLSLRHFTCRCLRPKEQHIYV